MAAPWDPYVVRAPSMGSPPNNAVILDELHHVAHLDTARSILLAALVDARIATSLANLVGSGTAVVWTSPNRWADGSFYGNVSFTFDFRAIVQGKNIYWLELDRRPNHDALRFLISSRQCPHLTRLTPNFPGGPLYDSGMAAYRADVNCEFLIEGDLPLVRATRLTIVDHHPKTCHRSPGTCPDLGLSDLNASRRFAAYLLSRPPSAAAALLGRSGGVPPGVMNVAMTLSACSDGSVNPACAAHVELALLALSEGRRDLAVLALRGAGPSSETFEALAHRVGLVFGVSAEAALRAEFA